MADMLLRTIQDLDIARGLLRSVGVALGLCYCHECAATAPAAMLTRIESLKRAGEDILRHRDAVLVELGDRCEELTAARAEVERLRTVLETLLYWHDRDGIDESWWDEARRVVRGKASEARCVRCLRGLGRPDGGVCAECDGAEEVTRG